MRPRSANVDGVFQPFAGLEPADRGGTDVDPRGVRPIVAPGKVLGGSLVVRNPLAADVKFLRLDPYGRPGIDRPRCSAVAERRLGGAAAATPAVVTAPAVGVQRRVGVAAGALFPTVQPDIGAAAGAGRHVERIAADRPVRVARSDEFVGDPLVVMVLPLAGVGIFTGDHERLPAGRFNGGTGDGRVGVPGRRDAADDRAVGTLEIGHPISRILGPEERRG